MLGSLEVTQDYLRAQGRGQNGERSPSKFSQWDMKIQVLLHRNSLKKMRGGLTAFLSILAVK